MKNLEKKIGLLYKRRKSGIVYKLRELDCDNDYVAEVYIIPDEYKTLASVGDTTYIHPPMLQEEYVLYNNCIKKIN